MSNLRNAHVTMSILGVKGHRRRRRRRGKEEEGEDEEEEGRRRGSRGHELPRTRLKSPQCPGEVSSRPATSTRGSGGRGEYHHTTGYTYTPGHSCTLTTSYNNVTSVTTIL